MDMSTFIGLVRVASLGAVIDGELHLGVRREVPALCPIVIDIGLKFWNCVVGKVHGLVTGYDSAGGVPGDDFYLLTPDYIKNATKL